MIKGLGETTLDVLIIGAGINGAVAASALSAAGLKVAIVEKNDFASGTSSASSNLIWGGIKYLENHEFKLVWKLCRSRNQLIKAYPTRIKPIRFMMSCPVNFRKSITTLYMGSWVYWYFGRCFTKTPKFIAKNLLETDYPMINLENVKGAIEYSDAYMPDNDARFTFQFIQDAVSNGAHALNYAEVKSLKKQNELWQAEIKTEDPDQNIEITAKAIINAAGPWANILDNEMNVESAKKLVFSKGIHLIVNKVLNEEKVLAFFANDGRLFFVIPMGDKSCIGTTDTRIENLPAKITDEDRQFILNNINELLNLDKPLSQDDVISERCGVRPLIVDGKSKEDDEWLQLSRKHHIDVKHNEKYIGIFGGKFTDCINIGEHLISHMADMGFSVKQNIKWFGEANSTEKESFTTKAMAMDLGNCLMGETWTGRLWRLYGPSANIILDKIKADENKAKNILPALDFMIAEAEYCAEHEFIVELEDFFRRRSMWSLIRRKEDILAMPSLKKLAEIFFGDKSEEKIERFKNAMDIP